jgi:hypothetical protein
VLAGVNCLIVFDPVGPPATEKSFDVSPGNIEWDHLKSMYKEEPSLKRR